MAAPFQAAQELDVYSREPFLASVSPGEPQRQKQEAEGAVFEQARNDKAEPNGIDPEVGAPDHCVARPSRRFPRWKEVYDSAVFTL
jgi:hypothetical protein